MSAGRGLAVVVLGAWLLACGGGDDDDPPGCTPGRSESCACPDGRQGAQTCNDDGSYGPCTCATAEVTPPAPPGDPMNPVGTPILAPTPQTPTEPEEPEAEQDCLAYAQGDAAERASAEYDMDLDPDGATTEEVDTNGDRVPEFVVQFGDLCGNAPSCAAWIYRIIPGCGMQFDRVEDRATY